MTQTKQKHTAGPWEVEIIKSGIDEVYARINGVAFTNSEKIGVYKRKLTDEAKANAALIAAAPEMLEALKEAVKLISSEYCFHNRACSAENSKCYAQKQLQAIAKAEGNS